MDGRGRPGKSGPLDGDGRRSLYLNVRRNFLTPMFLRLRLPRPVLHHGPAQRLERPRPGADPDERPVRRPAGPPLGRPRPRRRREAPPRARLAGCTSTAFGRPPTDAERSEALAFLDEQAAAYGTPDDPRAWADLCHVLINVKEFIFVD